MSSKCPILVIDDEYTILEILSRSLQLMGYNVEKADSGLKGIEKLSENEYCLVFTDYIMPDKDGKEILEYTRKQQKQTPVVGMSGSPWLLENNGFDAVLPKPFMLDDVRELAQRFCR